MSVIKVTNKETGLRKTINTYTIVEVNEIAPVEGEQAGCEVLVHQIKDKVAVIHAAESYEEVSKLWDETFIKPLTVEQIKNSKKKAKKKAPAKKKKVVKKKTPTKKKVVKKKTPTKKKVVKKKAK